MTKNKASQSRWVGFTLCVDDTSDIQPVVLLASQSISSQSGGVHLGECINRPTNLRQGYEADWIITVEAPVYYGPVSAQIEGAAKRDGEIFWDRKMGGEIRSAQIGSIKR